MDHTEADLHTIANEIRKSVILMSHEAKTPHLGSSLSCVDLLVYLYWSELNILPSRPDASNRDRFILSKGHAASALYATLHHKGFLSDEIFQSYGVSGSVLSEHPIFGNAPGIEATSGSLGHGLSIGLGMALAAKIKKLDNRVIVLLSDGECNEGTVWEAALLAPALKIDNLIAIIDYNQWQATGRSNEITSLSPLSTKFQAFGWESHEINGHSFREMKASLSLTGKPGSKPTAIIANTVKGKGISFMEDDNNWHYRIPNSEEVQLAMDELSQ